MQLQARSAAGLARPSFAARRVQAPLRAPLAALPGKRELAAAKDSAEERVATTNASSSLLDKLALPVATAVTAASLLACMATAPEPAMAARSGGRAGASSFAARRSYSAPRAAPTRAYSSPSSTTVVVAPPLFSPFGGFGYGGFGYGFGMPIFAPLGSLLQFAFLMLLASAVLNVVRGVMSDRDGGGSDGGSSNSKSRDWDDL